MKYFKIHRRHRITKYAGFISVACRVTASAVGLCNLDCFPNHRRSPRQVSSLSQGTSNSRVATSLPLHWPHAAASKACSSVEQRSHVYH
jgi:hypothetical protein